MNWKTKARLQNIVALAPNNISYSIYYWGQRQFGALKDSKLSPVKRLKAGVDTCKYINQMGRSPINATFLEIGTGRRINTPLAFWLLGAEKIITVDLNPYLKEELIRADLKYIRSHKPEVEELFGSLIFEDRLEQLLKLDEQSKLKDILQFLGIYYIAPGDASKLDLPDCSVDFHTSYTVLEHIPPTVIEAIVLESKRVLKSNGYFVHCIDYSDHFSHSDKSISAINFLQFSDSEWNQIAGNRYMYMNRLRHDDFLEIFHKLNVSVLLEDSNSDESLLSVLDEISLDSEFSNKSEDVLKITSSWLVCQK